MDMMTAQPAVRSGFAIRLLLFIVGVDEETLRLCPQRDWDNARAVGLLLICTWIYQTALFSIISHRLFAAPGAIVPGLLAGSAFLASFIMSIDSYVILRSGWNLQGLQELLRGGIDISGGAAARIKAGFFLAIRIVLSIGIAQLTAVFFSLLIFGSTITSRLEEANLTLNAAVIGSATALVDGQVQREADALKTETIQEAALTTQVTTLRQDQIDPSANDAQVQLAHQEVIQLLAQKGATDQNLQQAQTFASDELGGIKGAPGNSGIPGDGPRREAALEAVGNAKTQDRQLNATLATAQARLDALRSQSLTRDQTSEQQAHVQLPAFQATLADEDAKLATMKAALSTLEAHRDDAIRADIEDSPAYVAPDYGLLSQITILDQIAHENSKIAAVIILVDVTSFGFELAAVLAKVTSYVPTTYAALLARDAYMQVVRLVDDMMEELSAPAKTPRADTRVTPPVMSTDGEREQRSQSTRGTDPFSTSIGPLSAPSKRGRGRGRPRKVPPAA